jgi:hypothetical protein
MAAGAGFKTFNTGDVLSAADVNGYLMQGIWVFTNAAARDAAVTSPQEGNFAFTKDNNSLWYYDGAAWVSSGATGDIEGVTAGIGISGGGTSGTVTITNSMATEIDAKGDLVAGTGADTFARLAVGANNTVLTADSSTATGLKWAAAAGGGKVLQVVNASTTTPANSGSSTYADTGLTATITPTSSSSKILVLVNQNGVGKNNSNAGAAVKLLIDRGGTTFNIIEQAAFTNTAQTNYISVAGMWLDSPATTSATTYKTQFAARNSLGTVFVQSDEAGGVASRSSITLLEIGA